LAPTRPLRAGLVGLLRGWAGVPRDLFYPGRDFPNGAKTDELFRRSYTDDVRRGANVIRTPIPPKNRKIAVLGGGGLKMLHFGLLIFVENEVFSKLSI